MQEGRSSKKELTLTGQMEALAETVKSQAALLERQSLLLEHLTERLG